MKKTIRKSRCFTIEFEKGSCIKIELKTNVTSKYTLVLK